MRRLRKRTRRATLEILRVNVDLLKRAVEDDDPKDEILIRIEDMEKLLREWS